MTGTGTPELGRTLHLKSPSLRFMVLGRLSPGVEKHPDVGITER